MKRRSIFLICVFQVIALFVSFTILPLSTSFAKSLRELNREYEVSKSKISSLNNAVLEYQKKINESKLEINSLEGELQQIDSNIKNTDEAISDTEYRVEAKKDSIYKISKDIVKQEMELEGKKDILMKLVQEMYQESENGKIDLLELLLSSENFEEALNNVEYLEILHGEAEKNIRSIEEEKRDLETRKEDLKKENVELQGLLDVLGQSKSILKSNEDAKSMLLEETKGEEEKYIEMKQKAKEAEQALKGDLARVEDEISKEKERLSRMTRVSLGQSSLLWPVDGKITAYFMDPTYPFINILGQHMGIDIAAPRGTAMKAAHSGIVTVGYNAYGYGKYVLITAPSSDGGLISTLYGHMNSIYVKSDEDVKEGQVIGEVGSTGFSTGPHVHFEVRVDKTPVNPLIYLP